MRCSLIVLTLLTAACGTGRVHFRPAERAVAESPTGFPAAEYEVYWDNERSAEVRIWCTDAQPDDAGAGAGGGTVVEIGFEVENAGAQPVQLDLGGARLTIVDAAVLPNAAIAATGAPAALAVAPRGIQNALLRFLLPEDLPPRQLRAFRVQWALSREDGAGYEQHTGFRQDARAQYQRPFVPDPWLHWHWYGGTTWCW